MRACFCCLIGALCSAGPLPAAVAGDQIYRCREADGSVLFSDRACAPGQTGIDAPYAPAPGTRSLDTRGLGEDRPAPVHRRAATGQADSGPQRAYECSKRERRLEEVNAKLRRGYTASEGERLRRRRADLEDYIQTFCE